MLRCTPGAQSALPLERLWLRRWRTAVFRPSEARARQAVHSCAPIAQRRGAAAKRSEEPRPPALSSRSMIHGGSGGAQRRAFLRRRLRGSRPQVHVTAFVDERARYGRSLAPPAFGGWWRATSLGLASVAAAARFSAALLLAAPGASGFVASCLAKARGRFGRDSVQYDPGGVNHLAQPPLCPPTCIFGASIEVPPSYIHVALPDVFSVHCFCDHVSRILSLGAGAQQ